MASSFGLTQASDCPGRSPGDSGTGLPGVGVLLGKEQPGEWCLALEEWRSGEFGETAPADG